jgi:hypothetical protein
MDSKNKNDYNRPAEERTDPPAEPLQIQNKVADEE